MDIAGENWPMEYSVILSKVNAGYKENVITDLSLSVPKGAYSGILGANGSGKTTLLRVIGGLLVPRMGEVYILNRAIKSNKDRFWVKRHIGFLAQVQSSEQFPITVENSVLLGRWGRFFSGFKRPGKEDWIKCEQLLDAVGLWAERKSDLRELSGGQRQRAALARALAREPDLLLMDEPTTYLDPKAQQDLHILIKDLQRRLGITALVVTHTIGNNWDFDTFWVMEPGGVLRRGEL